MWGSGGGVQFLKPMSLLVKSKMRWDPMQKLVVSHFLLQLWSSNQRKTEVEARMRKEKREVLLPLTAKGEQNDDQRGDAFRGIWGDDVRQQPRKLEKGLVVKLQEDNQINPRVKLRYKIQLFFLFLLKCWPASVQPSEQLVQLLKIPQISLFTVHVFLIKSITVIYPSGCVFPLWSSPQCTQGAHYGGVMEALAGIIRFGGEMNGLPRDLGNMRHWIPASRQSEVAG